MDPLEDALERNVTSQEIDFAVRCESLRDYLMLLAGDQIGPAVRAKLDVQDLVQETLLKATRGRTSFLGEGDAQLRSWLRTILGNIMVDALRKSQGDLGARERSLHAMLEESSRRLEECLRDGGSSPSHKASRNERNALMAGALARLPEDQRRAVELHHLRGQPRDQVARQMGKSVQAVAGLLQRGLVSLRSQLNSLS